MVKKVLFLIVLSTVIMSCQQAHDPSVEQINSIFKTKDFTIAFNQNDAQSSMSFREDYVTYKTDAATDRHTLSYDNVLLINDFIASQYKMHDENNDTGYSIILSTDMKIITMQVPDYSAAYHQLINKLPL